MKKKKSEKVYFAKKEKSTIGGFDLLCGKCKSILYGYDEVICPCCGACNDFSKA